MDVIKERQVQSLVYRLKELFGRWANKDGVIVKYHKREPRVMFKMMTDDKLVIEIDYNINETSKEYIDNMIQKILVTIEARRKERHQSPIIIATGAN